MIETREVIIYEIIGTKVGSTYNIKRRMRDQGNPDYRIVQVIPPNTLTMRECWEQEQDWAVTLGYQPETDNQWQLVEKTRMGFYGVNWVVRKGSKNPQYKGTIVNSNGERFEGTQQLEEAGYHQGNVSACISGRRKTHKGLRWWREENT
jgi:hypothetical protein